MGDHVMYLQTGIVGVAILLVPILGRGARKSHEWQLFQAILATVLADFVFETAGWLLDGGLFPLAVLSLYIVDSISIILPPIAGFLWLYYTVERLSIRIQRKTGLLALMLLPLAINVALLIANPFTGLVFTIDSGHMYVRGPLLVATMLLTFLYPIVATVLALRLSVQAETSKQRRDGLVIASFMIPPIIAGGLQLLFYGTSLYLTGVAISLLIVFANSQNEQITIDYLTKINNRSSFIYYFEHRIRNVRAPSCLYLFMMDVDDFKHINDTYGHAVGDQVLMTVADLLKRACHGRKCFLARLGGDEFSILLECEEEVEAKALVDDIHARLDELNRNSLMEEAMRLSIGYTRCEEENTIDPAVRRADERMYADKRRQKKGRKSRG